jgi:transcriptional regulator with XRE-family HTH domain
MSRTFGEQLKAARAAVGLSRAQLAHRLGTGTTQVGYWETDTRTPDPERQREILAACRKPRTDVADLVAEFEADMLARIGLLAGDLETLVAARQVTPSAVDAVQSSRPARRRASR